MKCSQCDNTATDSGSGLCKECEDEAIRDHYKLQEQDVIEYYESLKRSLY